MAKRFIDSELFSDEWFSELSKDGKLLWIYFITSCDHSGCLKFNKKLIIFQTGLNNLDEILLEIGERIIKINDNLLFCPKFFKYQYPNWPCTKFRAADSAFELLLKYNIDVSEYLGISIDKIKEILTLKKELTNSYGNGKGIGNGIGGSGGILKQTAGTNPLKQKI